MAGVQPQPAQEWMATQLMAARNSSSIAASVDKSPRSIDYLDGDDDDDVDGDDEGDNGGDTTPGSLSTAATPFLPAPGEAASMPSFYAAMPVLGKDPLSSSKPLRVFDRTTFEAAFPQALANPAFVTSDISSSASVSNSADISFPSSTNSSASSIASSASIPASTPQSLDDLSKDPFFYPLLCANERRRLSEFWYLTSGIHDDRALATHLQSLLTIVKDLYDFDTAVIQLIDNDRSSSIDMNGWQETCCPRRETACAHTMLLQPGTVLSVADFLSDQRFANNKRLVEGRVRSYAGAPLAYTIDGSGETISLGSLCVFSFVQEKPPLTALQRESLCRFADLAIHAIKDRSRLRREHTQIKRHDILAQLSNTSGPPSHVVEATLAALKSALGGRAAFVDCLDDCIDLYNIGRTHFSQFQGGLWENVTAIEDFIKYHNHESSLNYEPNCTMRAIAVPLSNVNHHYLVVETGRLRDIYDGTDVLFVQSCAMVIASSIQDGLLRSALEAKSSFLRNAQHAFRTGLNGILSATDMLLGQDHPVHRNQSETSESLEVSQKVEKVDSITSLDLLRIIETSGRGLLTVINHLIDLDAQKASANLEVCDLHDLEEEVLESIVQHSSKEKMNDLTLISDSHLDGTTGDCIITDRLLLRQIISALVQNAVEATNGGGVVIVTIKLTGEPGLDQRLEVEVSDSGVGIAEKDQERIFQAFEKVDSFTPNAGLGLTFACQYAATLGGSVTLVRSQPGVGSVFKLSLSQPIIASNHQAFKLQSNLPKSWSYWMQQNRDKHELYSPYCAALRRLGLTPADSPSEASLLVQVMTRFGSVIAEEALSPLSNQVLLTLGWEDEHHSKSSGNLDHSRIAYGRLPWTRNRLVSTLLQAQKLARRNGEDGRPFTPVKELGSLDLSDPEQRSEVRALLVDDNAMNLSILKAYCKKRRYEYQSASDGNEAFRAYTAACEAGSPPTICLLDLQMPVCDGIVCARMIRAYEKQRKCSPCPIIMVTAQGGDADRREAIEAGTDAYYVKPLRVSTLDDIISRYARLRS